MKRMMIVIAALTSLAIVGGAQAAAPPKLVARTLQASLVQRFKFAGGAKIVITSTKCQEETPTAYFCKVRAVAGTPVMIFYNVTVHGSTIQWHQSGIAPA